MEKVIVTPETIYLYWGPSESAPAGMVNFRYGYEGSMKALTDYFDQCKKHMRYYKSQAAFAMDFSKQNLKRIHNDFGRVPVKSGMEYITDLKHKNSLFVEMVNKAQKAKTLPIDQLPYYDYKMDPLGEYQHRGVVLLNNIKRLPLFADCGLGKTFMVLVSTELQIKRGAVSRGKTLIAGKLATLETGWLEDAEMFTDLKIGMLWSSKSTKEKKYEQIMETLNDPSYDAFVINHDGLRIYEQELREHGFEKVVVDESTILKGFHGMERHFKGGEFGRSLMRVSEKAEWRVIMTGTPAPNGPQDLWGQLKFLNPEGFVLEPTWRDFLSTHFDQVYFGATNVRNKGQKYTKGPKKGELRYPNTPMGQLIAPHLKEGEPLNPNTPSKPVVKSTAIPVIRDMLAPWMYRLKLRENVEVPEDKRMKRIVDMTSSQKKHYNDMKEKLMVELEDGTEIRASIELAAYGKLRQITGGFIIDHEENAKALKKNPKMDMLDQLVEEEIDSEEKIVIFAEYQWEVKTITSRYKKYGAVSVYGGNSTKKNLDNIKKFKKGGKDVRIIVMHPQSASHGVNLTEACYLIFYSINFSAEFNYQAVGRILRANQKNAMFIYYLLCRNSIDTLAFDKIVGKNKDQDMLLDGEIREGVEQKVKRELLEAFREAV